MAAAAAAAAATGCVELHGFSRASGAYQPIPGLVHFLVTGALNSKKIECRRGSCRALYFGVAFDKSRGMGIREFGLSFAVQPESYKRFCSRRRLSDGVGNSEKGVRRFLVPLAAVATGAADWESRRDDGQESREFWGIWNFKPTSSGELLAVLGILALAGLVVVRVLRGSSLLTVGAIIFFPCLCGLHHRLKPSLSFLTEKLQYLKGRFLGVARLMPISCNQQTLGKAADNLLYSLSCSSPLLAPQFYSAVNRTSKRGKLIDAKDVANCISHLTSTIQNLDNGLSAEDVLSVDDLMNLQTGITELREDLYRAASALHAKENLLQSKLQSTAGLGSHPTEEHRSNATFVKVPSGHKVVTNFELTFDKSDSSGFSTSQQGPQSSSRYGPAGKKILQGATYQVITADYKVEPVAHFTSVALKTEADAGSLLSGVATSEVDGDRDKLRVATESLQVSTSFPYQIVSEQLVAIDTPEFSSDIAKQSGWSYGDSIEMKTDFPQKGKETIIENEYVLSLETQSLLSVNRIVAEEPTRAYKCNREDEQPMSVVVLDQTSTDPWHDDDRRDSSFLVMDEREDCHWETLIMQDTITPSPSGRWTGDDNDCTPYVSSVREGVVYGDGGGKGRGNAKPSVDFWGNKTATAGRPERGTLTRIKATRRSSLGSVDDVDNELPPKRSGVRKDEQMSQGQVRRRDSANEGEQKITSDKQYVKDEPELWDNEYVIDEALSRRRSIRGSQNFQASERDSDIRKVSAGDRGWSYGGRGSQNKKIIEEEGEYPDNIYYSQERTRSYNAQDDTQMLSEGDEEYFGKESRSGVPDEVGASRNGEDLGGKYNSQMRTSSSPKVPFTSRNRRQRVEGGDEEDDVEEDDRYRREVGNLEVEEQDYGSGRRRWADSQYPGREVQRGSDYDSEPEPERRNTDLPRYVQSEIEPEDRNLPVRQPSRIQLENFDGLLDEGEALLEEGMQGLEGRIEVGVAERMLYEAADLFEAAAAIDPSSLIAVGFWGNTLLVHGELKLKLSQQLRSMVPSSNSYSMVRARAGTGRDDQRESLELTLQNVCEECEVLLVDAGRKYRMALSLDRTDMRALYNWGLALCYRGQLIADEGGEKAVQDADKVYLAAIDKFEAMLGISQEYAAGALYNWGLAMRDRARLRPMGDRDRVKLLLQAKELFQDSVRLDPSNGQARGAVTAAVAELQELKRFEEMKSEQEINGSSSKSWWE